MASRSKSKPGKCSSKLYCLSKFLAHFSFVVCTTDICIRQITTYVAVNASTWMPTPLCNPKPSPARDYDSVFCTVESFVRNHTTSVRWLRDMSTVTYRDKINDMVINARKAMTLNQFPGPVMSSVSVFITKPCFYNWLCYLQWLSSALIDGGNHRLGLWYGFTSVDGYSRYGSSLAPAWLENMLVLLNGLKPVS